MKQDQIWWCIKSGRLLLSFTAAPQRRLCIEWYNSKERRPDRKYPARGLKCVKIEVREVVK